MKRILTLFLALAVAWGGGGPALAQSVALPAAARGGGPVSPVAPRSLPGGGQPLLAPGLTPGLVGSLPSVGAAPGLSPSLEERNSPSIARLGENLPPRANPVEATGLRRADDGSLPGWPLAGSSPRPPEPGARPVRAGDGLPGRPALGVVQAAEGGPGAGSAARRVPPLARELGELLASLPPRPLASLPAEAAAGAGAGIFGESRREGTAPTAANAAWTGAARLRSGEHLEPARVDSAREAVQLLGAENLRARLEKLPTLGREFARSAKRHWGRRAIADSTGKDLTYGKALTAGLLLTGLLRGTIASENVGVLLPPSAGGALANLSLEFLGKVPVNLNYSAGEEALWSAVRQSGMSAILTSKVFVQKLDEKTALLGRLRAAGHPVEEKFVYLEDLLPKVPKWKLALTYLALRLMPGWIIARLYLRDAARSMDANAAIIFTSGSSSEPKGVELTHGNIRANIEMLREVYPVEPSDSLLGVLPFFHVFGFTVTLWMTLLSGMSALYHTHPLETEAIEKLARSHEPTVLLGTPTFLMRYVQTIPKEAFARLRLVVAGAERLRESSAQAFKEKFGVTPLEGYGATETSPVVAVNVPDVGKAVGTKPGTVGRSLPGVAVRVADPDTLEPVAAQAKDGSREGMLLVKGPSVMKGYLGKPDKTAEALRDGWYVTGDIARVDRDGFITIVGRLSRFSKIAGEMVSHEAVEEKLHLAAGRTDMAFFVGGVPDEDAGGKGEELFVLYAGWKGSVDELLAKLSDLGLRPLWTPLKENFQEVDALPLLGTGKLDLKAAQALVKRASQGREGPGPRGP